MQEYVNELAQGLVDVDKNFQDVVAAEKIKRLCNESVSLYLSSQCHCALLFQRHGMLIQIILSSCMCFTLLAYSTFPE